MTEAKTRKLAFFQAMVEGMQQEMERDPRVFCMGEDVGKMGGVFQSTAGLHKRFPDRVIDTPISETGIMGAALGAASAGLRPIAELMFVDFMGVCFGQIMNEIGKATYMSGGSLKLPLVITASTGGGFSDAGQHSQTLHGLFAGTDSPLPSVQAMYLLTSLSVVFLTVYRIVTSRRLRSNAVA